MAVVGLEGNEQVDLALLALRPYAVLCLDLVEPQQLKRPVATLLVTRPFALLDAVVIAMVVGDP